MEGVPRPVGTCQGDGPGRARRPGQGARPGATDRRSRCGPYLCDSPLIPRVRSSPSRGGCFGDEVLSGLTPAQMTDPQVSDQGPIVGRSRAPYSLGARRGPTRTGPETLSGSKGATMLQKLVRTMGGVFEIIAAFHLRCELGNEWLLTERALTRPVRVCPHRRAGRPGPRGAVVDRLLRDRGRSLKIALGLPGITDVIRRPAYGR
jgi:hypothetical protein